MTLTRQQLDLARICGDLIARTYPGGDLTPNVVARTTDTQALVTKLPDGRFAVIIPGTASRRDVLTDINIIKGKYFDGYAHAGVLAAWRSINAGIRELLPAHAEVVIAGHSLGGGIAQVAAFELQGFRSVTNVITFGGLRTFNGEAAADYNYLLGARTLRFTNQGDPVPHAPLPLPILRTGIYTQTAHEIYLPEDGGYEVDRPWYSVALPFCAALGAVIQGKLNPAVLDFISVPAHFMTSYNERLKELSA